MKAEVERLGGRVAAHSVRGEGSTFTFTFLTVGVLVLKTAEGPPRVALLKAG